MLSEDIQEVENLIWKYINKLPNRLLNFQIDKPPAREIAVHLAVAVTGDVFDGVFLCFEIWDLFESVSEGFPTYSS